jgi:hypothetical protein
MRARDPKAPLVREGTGHRQRGLFAQPARGSSHQPGGAKQQITE